MTKPINKRVAIVTGGGRGIGLSIAKSLTMGGVGVVIADAGVSIDGTDPDPSVAQTAASEIGGAAIAFSESITTPSAAEALVDYANKSFGRIDIVVNNAAISNQEAFGDASTETIMRIMSLNMTAVARLTHHFLPDMIKRRSGRILNVASLASFHPMPSMDLYAATKAFVLSMTESLAENLKGTGVSITALCPGLTDTDALNRRIAGSLPPFLIAQAEQVANEGFDALMSQQVIRIPGESNKLATIWAQHQPRWLIRSLGGLVSKLSVNVD